MSGTTEAVYNQGFLKSTIEITVEFLSDIIYAIDVFSVCHDKNDLQRNILSTRLTSDISRFVEITTLLSKKIILSNPELLKEIKESHIHLLFVMKGLNLAQIKNDSIALEELIKYELKDNLTQWKIHLIPKLKMILNS